MNYFLGTVINKLKLFAIIFLISSGLFATCKKNECVTNIYQFKADWNIVPQKDSINIGDTLFFGSMFSNQIFDYNSNKNIDFSGNASIGTSFSVRVIKGYNNLQPAIDSFSFFVITGKCEPGVAGHPEAIKDISWSEISGNYQVKFGIVAKKRGDYSFTLSDAFGKKNGTGDCGSNATIYLANSNGKNNAYLSYVYYGLNYVPATDSTHIFCIRVK